MADLLLVDNDARIVELLAWFLRRCGHEVRTAESYGAAREQVQECLPDLMLADLELTRERGEEELPRLAADGLLPPTLVVSGYLDSALEQKLLAIDGVLGTLAKPFDLDLLKRRIDESLDLASESTARSEAAVDSATGPTPPGVQEDDDDDGWIEIVAGPTDPPVPPAPPTALH